MAETSAIWKESHVVLRWVDADEESATKDSLPVLILSRVVPVSESAPWTVGELVRMEGSRALAIASITGALRVVEESQLKLPELPVLRDRVLGVVLGRAVAHEIGHYLLRTNTHASHGLMRASINAREFSDLRSGTFHLDKAAQAHVAGLVARGALLPERTISEFSYSN